MQELTELIPDCIAAVIAPLSIFELPVGTFSLTNSLEWFVLDQKLNGLCERD